MSFSTPSVRPFNRRVLVVDDSSTMQYVFSDILVAADEGFELAQATDGKKAVALALEASIDANPFALAFVDVELPGWDGFETIQRLWSVDEAIQIVICTGQSTADLAERLRPLGATDNVLLLKKPFDAEEILQLARALSSKWALRRAQAASLAGLSARTRELERAKAQLEKEMAERARVESELRLAQKLEAVGQLASGVAHEISTPMQYVSDTLYFVQQSLGASSELFDLTDLIRALKPGDPALQQVPLKVSQAWANAGLDTVRAETGQAVARAIIGVERVTAIVRALRELAHPGTGAKEPADLNHALRLALEVAGTQLDAVADVVTDFGNLPLLSCHPGELGQLFVNLLVNAGQAIAGQARGGARGTITVTTRQDGDVLVARVADTGPGVPAELRERIFDPFFTTKPAGMGSGQGLGLARAIVTRHGGTIELTRTGPGAEFTVRLPLVPPALQVA